ncbi:isoprenylcysteine carboxylmethyltransferase family protein [Leucobacter zeae]|nr:isoprenylcysteine carboxylmethyltransferase family protein [Leucobacter zeae]
MLSGGLGRLYFALQAAAGAAWWITVFTVPTIRTATLGRIDPVAMAALDVPLFVLASAAAALGLRPAVWIAATWTALISAGMAAYATATGEAGLGALLMVAATIGSAGAALLVLLGRLPSERILVGPLGFGVARPARRIGHGGRTTIQIIVFWGLFLAAIPVAIVLVERRWGLAADLPAAIPAAGVVILVAASALGIWAAAVMSSRGDGTPLPSDAANRLVIAGPYRFVRNPMALAGITQGVAVGMIAESWLVVVYALCGSLVWNRMVRPLEEADLEARFGDEFTAYRDRVRCWVPGRPVAPRAAP